MPGTMPGYVARYARSRVPLHGAAGFGSEGRGEADRRWEVGPASLPATRCTAKRYATAREAGDDAWTLRLTRRFALTAALALVLLLLPAAAEAGRRNVDPQRQRANEPQRSQDRQRPDSTSRPEAPATDRAAASSSRQQPKRGSRQGAATAKTADSHGLAAIRDKIAQPDSGQRQSSSQLQQDLQAIADGLKSADDEIRQLGQDLQGMAITAPDPALVQSLATDLAAAVDDGDLSPVELAQLADDVYAVLNSAGLSQAELAIIQADVEAILAASGVGRAEIEAVLRDLQAIYDQMQAG